MDAIVLGARANIDERPFAIAAENDASPSFTGFPRRTNPDAVLVSLFTEEIARARR
jgi:hypothetical protein